MANTYTFLASANVGSGGATSISFDNIPQTYTDLIIKFSTRDARASLSVSDIIFNFNNTGTGISGQYIYGNGSSTVGSNINSSEIAFGGGNGASSNTFGSTDVYIHNYTSSRHKPIFSDSISETNGTGGYQLLLAATWANTAAITSIIITPFTSPFSQYSVASLYGIQNT